jgi:hypothetical protein
MINEQLLQYIKKQREAGTSDEDIKEKLRSAGWKDEDIADGFDAVSGNDNSPESHQKMRQKARESGSKQSTSQPESSSGSSQAGQQQTQQPTANQSAEQSQKQGSQQQAKQQTRQQSGPGQSEQASNQQSDQEQSGNQESQNKQAVDTKQNVQQSAQNESEQTDQDNYREPVTEEDKGGAGATGPGRPSANEDPTPLRTMEADRQRVQDGEVQNTSEEQAQSLASRQNNDEEELQEAVQQQVEKEKEKQKKKEEFAERKQQEELEKAQRQSNQDTKGSVSSLAPQESQPGKQEPQGGQQNQQEQNRIQQARKQSSSSGVLTIALSILGLLLVGGGAAYGYITYFQGPSNDTSAQAVLQSLADAESFQYRIGINKQSRGASGSGSNGLVIEGAVDMNPNSSAETYYTISSGEATSTAPVTGIASEFSQYPNLDERKQQAVQQALNNQQFLQVNDFQTAQRLGATQNSSGFQTHRFGVTVNPERLLRAYTTIHEEIYGESINSQLASVLQDNLGNFTPEQGQLWVHPTSSVPYQLTVVGSNADGESLQVNMQFKNHGEEITAVTNAYETRSIASGFGDYLGATSTSPQGTSTASGSQEAMTSTTSSNNGSQSSGQADDSTSVSNENEITNTESELRLMRRQDQIRINDVQQLLVALQVYANVNGQYPRTLATLTGGSVLNEIPRDPETGRPYSYTVSNSGNRFHLGATLRATNESELPDNDANFNSESATSMAGGFDGAADNCASVNQNGSTCYDRSRSQ